MHGLLAGAKASHGWLCWPPLWHSGAPVCCAHVMHLRDWEGFLRLWKTKRSKNSDLVVLTKTFWKFPKVPVSTFPQFQATVFKLVPGTRYLAVETSRTSYPGLFRGSNGLPQSGDQKPLSEKMERKGEGKKGKNTFGSPGAVLTKYVVWWWVFKKIAPAADPLGWFSPIRFGLPRIPGRSKDWVVAYISFRLVTASS